MGRHRRYPVKKTKKIKAKDPIERMQAKPNSKRPINCVPKKNELDDQKVPRKWREIQETSKILESKQRTRSGKKRAKNKFFEMTAKMGFQKRPWENEAMLANRIIRSKNKSIDDEMIKVKTGTAGVDPKQLDKDLKELDEIERRKKLAKVAAAEKKRKLREKNERFKQSQLAKHADFDDFDDEMDADSEEEQPQSDDEAIDDDDNEQVQSQVMRKPTTKQVKQQKQQQPDVEVKKRLTPSEKMRLKKKEENEERKRYLMFNAREIIPFGERVDAPPKFTSGFRKTLDPLFAQAGKKDLLLKDLLDVDKRSLYSGPQTTEESSDYKVTEEERQRYINAYRKLKLNKT